MKNMSNKSTYKRVPVEDDSQSDEETVIFEHEFGRGKYKANDDLIFHQQSGTQRLFQKLYSFLPHSPRPKTLFLIFTILSLALLLILVIGLVFRSINGGPSSAGDNHRHKVIGNFSANWMIEINDGITEMSVILHDLNEDYVPDVLLANISNRFQSSRYTTCPGEMGDKCQEVMGFSPCQVRLVGLDGTSGDIVWGRWVEFEIFAANCRADLNSDGLNDCIFGGREGALAAVDVHHDNVLWLADASITCPYYNYLFPLLIDDVDYDSVKDIVITHGGDPTYPDSEINRTPGFVVVISGSTGRQISDHILTPDDHETYSSPVLYRTRDGAELVLFGSGGETIQGSLWALTLNSLKSHVNDYILKNNVPPYHINKMYLAPSCNDRLYSRPILNTHAYSSDKHEPWMDDCPRINEGSNHIWNKYTICMYEFVPGGSLGTMVPPVIVDMDRDGVMDVVVSQFGEHTLLYNGRTGSITWDHFVPNTQSYSIPAPLHFNDDGTLDLLVRINKGRWMKYDYSYMGVLDGTNGDLLWSFNCSMAVMNSPVTLLSKEKGQDAMIFVGNGCGQDIQSNAHKSTSNSDRQKRNANYCPRERFEITTCSAKHRDSLKNKRHEEEEEEMDHFVVYNSGDGEGDPSSPPLDVTDLSRYLPPDLWTPMNETDSFPDPWGDKPEDFIEGYCGYNIASLEASVYFITPQMIHNIKPLHVFGPYIHSKSNLIFEYTLKE
jgi:hypothetical protein